MKANSPLARLRHHVTGAIERGEAQAIAGVPASPEGVACVPEKEYTLEDFRKVAVVGKSSNGRGFLSGASRAIDVLTVTWPGMNREYTLTTDESDEDPVKSIFEELQKCIIRDCLIPPSPAEPVKVLPYTLVRRDGPIVSRHKTVEAARVAQQRKGLVGVSDILLHGERVPNCYTGIPASVVPVEVPAESAALDALLEGMDKLTLHRALKAEKKANAAHLAKIAALEDVAKALVEGWPNSGAVINVHASIFSAARAALALPSAPLSDG